MGDFQKTPTPNLVRHVNGTYYLRARFGAGPVRESLHTTKYQTARDKLDLRMAELRGAGVTTSDAPQTLRQAVEMLQKRVQADPSLKKKTQESYGKNFHTLLSGKVALPTGELRRLTPAALRAWWARIGSELSPQRANHMLMWVRQAVALARKCGAISRDITEGLKRVKIPRKRLALLSGEQFRALIAEVRKKRNRHDPHESADWIEFATYSGLRPAELAALRWEDINDASGFLSVHGGEQGTKNRTSRPVPILPILAGLLTDMRSRRETRGIIFKIKSPGVALRNACKRLGFPHQRLYDLRHTFATMCAKSGVDVPTFSRWLGHRDGGALAMRVYVHPDEEHSRESAKKVRF